MSLDVHQDRFQIIHFVDGEFEPRAALADTEAVFSITELKEGFTKVAVQPRHPGACESPEVVADFTP